MSDITPEEQEKLRKYTDARFAQLNAAVGHPDGKLDVEIDFPTAAEFAMAARHVLWRLDGDRELGLEPGGFITLLIDAMCHADFPNLQRLALAFPAYATAVSAYKGLIPDDSADEGIAAIRTMATMI